MANANRGSSGCKLARPVVRLIMRTKPHHRAAPRRFIHGSFVSESRLPVARSAQGRHCVCRSSCAVLRADVRRLRRRRQARWLGESESRGGRFCVLLPEAEEGASACVCARATSQREAGGRRRAETLKGPAVRRGVTIRDGDGSHLVLEVAHCVLGSSI